MMSNFFTLTLLHLLPLIAAEVSISDVFQFNANGTWAENLVVRPNGKILVTRADVPELWQVDPLKNTAELIESFTVLTGLLGITRLKHDKYAVVGSQLSLGNVSTVPGSNEVIPFEIDGDEILTGTSILIPSADLINGITTFDEKKEIILMADSALGVLYRLNIKTGDYDVILDDPTMDPAPNKTIGINGVKVLGNYIYYTSSTQSLFCRVRVDKKANPVDDVEVIANITSFFLDDFIIHPDKTAYIATNPDNEIFQVSPKGIVSQVAGSLNGTDLIGATAVVFADDEGDSLYVTTSGGLVAPINGTITEPWKVVKVYLQDPNKDKDDDLDDYVDDKYDEDDD